MPASAQIQPMPRIRALRDAGIGYGLLPWVSGPMWELQERYVFRIVYPDRDPGRLFEIPEGYQFNKASVPPLFWGFPFGYTPDGLCTVPALEHDFLCDLLTGGSAWLRERLHISQRVPPPAADIHEHFRLRLLQFGVRRTKAAAMAGAVKAFGPGTKLGRLLGH